MLLRNYDNIMTARQKIINTTGTIVSTDTTRFGDGHINACKISDGTKIPICASTNWSYNPLEYFVESETDYKISYGGSVLFCGGGNTAVAYDDIQLESPFSESQVSFEINSSKIEEQYDEVSDSWIFNYTITLIAKESIEINEMGVKSLVYTSNNLTDLCLVYRKVFDNTVEVPKDASFVLAFTKTVSANPNKPAKYDAAIGLV